MIPSRFLSIAALLVACGSSGGSDDSSSSGTTGPTGSSGADGSGEGGDACQGTALDPAALAWEALPNLADSAEDHAGQCMVLVDGAGEIYVAGSFASAPAWDPPWRLELHRYDGAAWELVGGAPVDSGDAGATVLGLAKDDGGTLMVLLDKGGQASLLESSGGAWTAAGAIDPAATGFAAVTIASDRQGRVLAMIADESEARVYRRDGGAWAQLGGALVTEGAPVVGSLVRGRLATNCGDDVAAIFEREAFLFVGDAWQDLGEYAPMAEPYFPRVALGPDARPIVSWRVDGPKGTLLYTSRWEPTTSVFELLDSPHSFEGPGASYVVPAVNDGGDVLATWRESTVYLAQYRDGQWAPLIGDGDVAAPTQGGTLPDIAVGPDGLPVECWESFVGDNGVIGVGRARAM